MLFYMNSNTVYISVRPLAVKLRWKPTALIAGEEYVISCESVGSRPKAELTWWMDDKLYEGGKVVYYLNSNSNRFPLYSSWHTVVAFA